MCNKFVIHLSIEFTFKFVALFMVRSGVMESRLDWKEKTLIAQYVDI